MILQELNLYYKKLLDNPDIIISKPGFSKENISFKININQDGSLFDIHNPMEDLRKIQNNKAIPVKINVPKFDGKRASGIKPYFLWDKTDYIIGIKKDKYENIVETPEHHKRFLSLIDDIKRETKRSHPAIDAVYRFCSSKDNIDMLKTSVYWDDFLNSFVVFNIPEMNIITIFDIDEINGIWEEYYSSLSDGDESVTGICLVKGEKLPLARLHPTIKKGVGGKNDIPLISFNFSAAESYNKSKNENASISVKAASAIAGSLNYMLENNDHNIAIADTRTVFWAEENDEFSALFGGLLDGGRHDGDNLHLKAALQKIRSGKLPQEMQDDSRFFVLGLSPNAARISVRYWLNDSIDRFSKNLLKHFNNLRIAKQSEDKDADIPSVWQLIIETAVQHKTENIPPNITGPFMRAILSDTQYPLNVLSLLIGRTRADQGYQKLNYYRASFIKAILNRNYKKELTMALDHQRNTIPYLLGRLFSVLEKAQEESSGGNLNATIKDRYFSSASTKPQTVFPRLLTLHQNHIKKLKSDRPGRAVNFEKLIGEIIDNLPPVLPASLKLEDQGEFAIGYYHQRQDFFKKKETE